MCIRDSITAGPITRFASPTDATTATLYSTVASAVAAAALAAPVEPAESAESAEPAEPAAGNTPEAMLPMVLQQAGRRHSMGEALSLGVLRGVHRVLCSSRPSVVPCSRHTGKVRR